MLPNTSYQEGRQNAEMYVMYKNSCENINVSFIRTVLAFDIYEMYVLNDIIRYTLLNPNLQIFS